MKYHYSVLIIIIVAWAFFACEDDNKKMTGEQWNSEPIKEYAVQPINGGATITYAIPNDPDLLCVMAEYERNGKTFTETSSMYKNSLTLEGFHRVNRVQAKIYKVNKSRQKSAQLIVEFEPLESPIDIAASSLEMQPMFGGIMAKWENPLMTEFGVRLFVPDSLNNDELVTREIYFSTLENEKRAFRGFASEETTFGISFEDKWGNISDTVTLTTTPYFEVLVPKPYADFRTFIPYDNTSTYRANYTTDKLWDNIANAPFNGFLTRAGNSGLSFTIDIKQVVKLSRIVIHGYHCDVPYDEANILQFELWGTDKIDYDKLLTFLTG